MRVPMIRGGRRDEGAVAIMLTGALVIFILLAAFTTDYGLAYWSKRQLQTGADAAALASAGLYADKSGDCASLRSAYGAQAASTASSVGQINRNGDIAVNYSDTCISGGLALETSFSHGATTDTILGSIAAKRTAAERSAKAQLRVPPGVSGLRPYMVCVSDAERLRTGGTTAIQTVYFPGPSCGSAPGNWYTIECPAPDDGSGNPTLGGNTLQGCSKLIYGVDPRATPITDPPTDATAADILARLIAACASEPRKSQPGTPGAAGPPATLQTAGCMVGDTGNDMTSTNVSDAWTKLLDQSITLPVFDPASVHNRGSNVWYPVKGFLAVQVCGYHWQSASRTKTGLGTSASCSGAAYPLAPTTDNYLLLRYTGLVYGGSSQPSTCVIGDPTCDFGRQVFLTQ